MADWFYVPSWKRVPLQSSVFSLQSSVSWLIFLDECGLGSQLAEQLENRGHSVITVKIGSKFAKLNDGEYTFNPEQYNDYNLLFSELRGEAKIPNAIVHLWSVTPEGQIKSGLEQLDSIADSGFSSLVFIAQALAKHDYTERLQITVVSNNLHEVIGGEPLRPEKATVIGPVRVIPQEYPNISCRSIDIVLPESGTPEEARVTDRLMAELGSEFSDPIIAFRGNYRWIQSFEPVRLPKWEPEKSKIREKGVYLITGGLGGIGGELAEFLIRTAQAKLVLTGRTQLPERELWEEWLLADDADSVGNDFCADIVKKRIEIGVNMDDEADIINQHEERLRGELGIPGIKDYEGLEETLNDLCASYICDYFRAGGIRMEKGQIYESEELKSQLGILPKFEKFYDFFIKVLSEDSVIRAEGGKAEFLKGEQDVKYPVSLSEEAEKKISRICRNVRASQTLRQSLS